ARSIFQLARVRLRIGDQVGNRMDGERLLDDHGLRNHAHDADRAQVLERMILHLLRHGRDRHGTDAADTQRVTVWVGLGDRLRADDAARAGAVVDDHIGAERLLQVAGRDASHEVGISTRSIGYDQADGSFRPVALRVRCAGRSAAGYGGAEKRKKNSGHHGQADPPQLASRKASSKSFAAFASAVKYRAGRSMPENSTRRKRSFSANGTEASMPSLVRM